jgi:predicted MFS family arabinose efflux permease
VDPDQRISRRLLVVLAVTCGIVVANLYYSQPLLPDIERDFHVGSAATSAVVVLTQLGYAAGLLLVVPLGDRLERRRFIWVTLLLTSVALAGAAAAGNIGVLIGALLAVGLTSVIVQVLVPFAADLAGEAERGQVVGTVVSGLLIGILGSRTIAGLVGQAGGWRAIYVVAAVLMVVVAAALRHELPVSPAKGDLSYRQLLASVAHLAKAEPLLRRRAAYGALAFGSFSVLWTSISFLLAKAPFHYDSAQIGLFGLAGIAGALCASVAGRLVDGGHERAATATFLAATAVSFVVLLVGSRNVVVLLLGVVILDFGVQGAHVSNQGVIFRIAPEARSRINTVYMTSYFLGGSLGSLCAAALWSSTGWRGVCALGAALPLIALALWVTEPTAPQPAQRVAQ